MTCHNINGWAACTRVEGMISVSKLGTRVFPSRHLHERTSMRACRLWPFTFLHLLSVAGLFLHSAVFWGFLLRCEEALSCRSVCAEAVFSYPD